MKKSLALFTIILILFSYLHQINNYGIELQYNNIKLPLNSKNKSSLIHDDNKNYFKKQNNLYNNENYTTHYDNENIDIRSNSSNLSNTRKTKKMKSKINNSFGIMSNSGFSINAKLIDFLYSVRKEEINSKQNLVQNNRKNLKSLKNTNISALSSNSSLLYPDERNSSLWTKSNCFFLIDNNFYDLFKIKKSLSILTEGGYIIDFNLCKNLVSDNGKRAMVLNKSKGIRFSDEFKKDKIIAVENKKIYLDLPLGDYCNKEETEFYRTTVILKCNPTISEPIIRNSLSGKDAFNKEYCRNYIKIETKEACSKGEYIFWYKVFGVEDTTIGLILIIIGTFFLVLGEKLSKITCLVMISLTMGVVIKTYSNLFIVLNMQSCFTIGITLAVLTLFYNSLRNVLLSNIIGFISGNVLYNFLIQVFNIEPNLIYWLCIACCTTLMLIFGFIFENAIVIVSTSAFGAYSFIRGVSFCIGGFPEEIYSSKLISYGEFNQINDLMDKKMIIYLISMGGFFILGFLLQTFLSNSSNDTTKLNRRKRSFLSKSKSKNSKN